MDSLAAAEEEDGEGPGTEASLWRALVRAIVENLGHRKAALRKVSHQVRGHLDRNGELVKDL